MADSGDIRRLAAELARDRASGATALAARAARALGALARDDGKSLARWQHDLRAAAAAMAAAQPAMASLLTVGALAERAAAGARTPAAGARAVRRALARYLRSRAPAAARAARRLPARLPRGATCLTLSASEVCLAGLLAARRRGRLGAVVVAESRPGLEGVEVARRLAARRVPVVVVTDALAVALVPEVDAVVIGADAVTRTAVWNKCGTLALALGARAARRPLLVVTTEDRLLGPTLARRLRVPEAEPADVLERPPAGVRARNRLFDVTPLALVRRVLTERAAATPAALRARLS